MKKFIFWILLITHATIWAADPIEELPDGLYAKITTSKGLMIFDLDYQNTPLTVLNFCGLAKGIFTNSIKETGQPFYDGLPFYRVIKGYAVFTGDPDNNGNGGPGYSIPREMTASNSAKDTGILVMDGLLTESSGSRFFITIYGDEFLDRKYTSFGKIVHGENILKRLKKGDVIEKVEILPIGFQASAFTINQQEFDRILTKVQADQISMIEKDNPDLAKAILDMGEGIKKTETGIYYSIITEGSGTMPKHGNKITMHYSGKLLDGTVFDSSKARDQPFEFVLGQDSLIPGWVAMIMQMKKDETRKVIIPPNLAYGTNEYGPIPANSWLIFELTILDISEE